MKDKFPNLNIISAVLKVLCYIALIVGLYYFIYEGIIEPILPNHSFGPSDILQLQIGGVIIFFSLLTIAFCELIQVFIEIEKNTRLKE
ncbi:MAG: hypothetical protein EHM93_18880 [Bacteroidales bacterium]|nr:MAG: hypothetical protein EHM93_18880 [Bacteroidales bacterium]